MRTIATSSRTATVPAAPRRCRAALPVGLALVLGLAAAPLWPANLALGQASRARTTLAQNSDRTTIPQTSPGTPPERMAPGAGARTPNEAGTGVLRAPGGVDPGIRVPAPNPTLNTTPVIPPPGTPGGNPNVQPR